ncbi:tyrosine-type recombinase/integrase [Laribacter hongkongensis]|uniref:tyrosine-type recombinase/integrase n=2 Tax=Bacteria TaxID=2 RepID=UPI001EFD6FDD|nr:site-specific integrase [Laribacter hongkongensis]MCG9125179.1 tyrosine-type recombinase/integrase [Laribacter hongkongensis]
MAVLTDRQAASIKPTDKAKAHGGVVGLWLMPLKEKGTGKWIFRFTSPASQKRRDMGLGSYPATSIKQAGESGEAARLLVLQGVDPIDHKREQEAAAKAASECLTFENAAIRTYETLSPGWSNRHHGVDWINSLRRHVFPKIGARPVADLVRADFADVLQPIWLALPDTAGRVRRRMHTVMEWCLARDLIAANQCDSALSRLLPKQPSKAEREEHHPAMPWRLLPAFVAAHLGDGKRYSVIRPMLEFLILTAARSGEVRGMTWGEVDLKANIWTIPGERMKAGVTHQVPLSDRAITILRQQREQHPLASLVFPAPRGSVASDMTLTKYLRDVDAPSDTEGRPATAHGFRSTFKDWTIEHGYPGELSEKALAHSIKNKVEAAYHRSSQLEQRRELMQAWSEYVESGRAGGITNIRQTA